MKFIFLFSKDALNWSKVTVKTFYNIAKDFCQINAVILINHDFHKNIYQHNSFPYW